MNTRKTPKYLAKFFADSEGNFTPEDEMTEGISSSDNGTEIDLDQLTDESVDEVVDEAVNEAFSKMQSKLRTKLRAKFYAALESEGMFPATSEELVDQTKSEESVLKDTKMVEATVATQTRKSKKFTDEVMEDEEIETEDDEMTEDGDTSLEDSVNELL